MSERGKLQVDVEGNQSGFQATLNAAKMQAKQFAGEINAGFGRSWGGLGKGLVGGLVAGLSFSGLRRMVSGVLHSVEELKNSAEQFDLSTDAVQKWEKALGKAGVTTSVFYHALENIRMRRSEGLQDPAKLAAFEKIGLGEAARDPGIDDEQLLRLALKSGATRTQLRELLGPLGPTLKPAAGHVQEAVPTLSPSDLKQLESLKSLGKGLGSLASGYAKGVVVGLAQFFDPGIWKSVFKTGGPKAYLESRKAELDKAAADEKKAREEDFRAAEFDRQEKELAEQAKKDADAKEKLRVTGDRFYEAQRRNMPTAKRRKSLQEELSKVEERIKYYEEVFDALSDADLVKLDELRIRREGLKGELREKPMQLPTDTLAKAGLYSQSALNFSTSDSTERQQVALLRQILSKLSTSGFYH